MSPPEPTQPEPTPSPSPWLRRFQCWIGVVLIWGIGLRFAHLDQKPYWQDETYTLLRLSGHSLAAAIQQLYTGQVIPWSALQPFQQLSPATSAIDTIQRLAAEVPQHPPLYFVLARFWTQFVSQFASQLGTPASLDPAAIVRSFSAAVSLLGFPALYWLCLELWGAASVGWLAMGLFAVSPIYIRYAQEARPYSLWIVLVLLSSGALLRAMRLQNLRSWSLYAITIAAALYCHLLTGFVVLSHSIYVVAAARFRWSKALQSYGAASLVGGILFSPWLWVLWTNRNSAVLTTQWVDVPLPLTELLTTWGLHLCQAFVAWHFQYNNPLIYLSFPLAILVTFAIVYLYRHTIRPTWILIVSLIFIPILALVLPDLIWAGRRSSNIRYFLSSLLGIHLAVAYLLSSQISQSVTRTVRFRFWQSVTLLLISTGVWSGVVSAQASTWWGWSEYDVAIGNLINQTPNALVISDMPIGVVLPLSHQLDPQTQLLLLTEPEQLTLPSEWSHGFVYNPSEQLRATLKQQGIASQLVYQFQEGTFRFSLYAFSLP